MAGRGVVGLDIGTAGVRAAELSVGSKGPMTLQRFGQVGLPLGAVVNGEVVQVDAVAEAIKQLWRSVKFSCRKVAVGLANQKVVVRLVDLPWLPEKELRKSLGFQVADVIPMPVDQAIVDFFPLEDFVAENGGRMQRVMLVAAVREMVNSTIAAVTKAGLEPVNVDLTPFAVLRTLARSATSTWSADCEAFVDMGASVTNIVVHQAGVPRFVRILLSGGADLTAAVGERMGVAFEEAEGVKQSLGLATAQTTHPAARVISGAADAWVEEVRSSLDFYRAQAGSPQIRRLVLSGGGARLAGLQQRLAVAARMEVHLAAPLEDMTIGRTGLSPEQLSYVEPQVVVPVGLALGRAS